MHLSTLFSLAAAFLASVSLVADEPPGAADPSFDAGTTVINGTSIPFTAAAVLPDGSAVLAGPNPYSATPPKLLHIFADGRYDYGYGFNPKSAGAYKILAYQPGEGLLVVGSSIVMGKNLPANLLRLNDDGSLDPSFVADRTVNTAPLTAIAVLPDHSVLVARSVSSTSGPLTNRPSLLVKLHPNGVLDDSFKSTLVPAAGTGAINAIQVLEDGRILAAGHFVTERTPAGQFQKLTRLLPDGALDPTFEEPTSVAISTDVYHLIPVEDGLLVSVRDARSTDSLVRLHSDGTEDWFLSNYRLQPPMQFINGVIEQPDGHLIIGGVPGPGFTNSILVRIRPDGTEDRLFPSRIDQHTRGTVGGFVRFPDGGLLAYGSFVVAGQAKRPGFVRILADGTPDNSFGRIGPYYGSTLQNAPVDRLLPLHDGLLIAGSFSSVDGVLVGRLAKLGLDGALDTHFVTNAVVAQTELRITSKQFELPDGRIFIVSANQFMSGKTNLGHVIRLLPDGRLDSSLQPYLQAPTFPLAVALQPDGTLLMGVRRSDRNPGPLLGVVRLLTDGTIDKTFALPLPPGVSTTAPVAAILAPRDGRIVVATSSGFVGRYDTSGQLEGTFERVLLPILGSSGPTLAQLPSGDVYATGYSINSTNGPVTLVHWNPDGTFDRQFRFPLRGRVDEVLAAGPERIIVHGTFLPETTPVRVYRCFPDGNIDASFVLQDRIESLRAMAVADDRVYISGVTRNSLLSTNFGYEHVARYSNRIAPFSLPVINETKGHFVTLNFFGPAGWHYYFDASSDLVHWTQIADEAIPTNGIVPLLDDLPKEVSARFYRARAVE